MGMQNALVRLLLQGCASTNVMTANTTQLAIDLTETLLAWCKYRGNPDEIAISHYVRATNRVANYHLLCSAFWWEPWGAWPISPAV